MTNPAFRERLDALLLQDPNSEVSRMAITEYVKSVKAEVAQIAGMGRTGADMSGGQPLACALFGAAAWQCAARDRFIGWTAAQRQRGLPGVVNQARFLILPWVRVPHLASHLLAQLTGRLSADWSRKYGHPVFLVETFVELGRFAGTCYRAANWVAVGATTGRTRQTLPQPVPRKAVWVYPLHPRFRQRLGVDPAAAVVAPAQPVAR